MAMSPEQSESIRQAAFRANTAARGSEQHPKKTRDRYMSAAADPVLAYHMPKLTFGTPFPPKERSDERS